MSHAGGPKRERAAGPAVKAASRIAVAAWMSVIFAVSSLPGSKVPGGYSAEGHFLEYAVLGALLLFALGDRDVRRTALLALAVCAVYAVTDEYHQSFVPGRVPDVADWAVDTLGAGWGVALAVAAERIAGGRGRSQ